MIHTNVDDALIFYTYWRKPRFFLVKDGINGTSLVVWWLRLWALDAGGLGLIPGQGTSSLMLQLRLGTVKNKNIFFLKNTKSSIWMYAINIPQKVSSSAKYLSSVIRKKKFTWPSMANSSKSDIPQFSSVHFSRSVVSDSLRPHESQHTRPPCPSPTPGVHPNSCPSSQWCHPAISSLVVPFSSCPQSLPTSKSFPMSSSHEVAKVLEFQL